MFSESNIDNEMALVAASAVLGPVRSSDCPASPGVTSVSQQVDDRSRK